MKHASLILFFIFAKECQRERLLEIAFVIFLGNLNCMFSSSVTRDDRISHVTQFPLFDLHELLGSWYAKTV